MALRDQITQIVSDMATLQAFAATPLKTLDVNALEGFSDPAPSIAAELSSLVASRKSIEKQIVSINKKITDLVQTNLNTL